MKASSIGLSAVVAVSALFLGPMNAEAGTRLHFNYFAYEPGYQTYYPGPVYVPRPRYFYYYDYDPDPPYAYDYEPEYYEPEYQPRRYKQPTRPYSARKQKAGVNYDEPAVEAVKPKKVEPAKKKVAAGISCDKAAKIVADYGFKSVQASSCKGSTYSFKGSRDGKSYAIKLSSKSGELTEVKKL